MQLKAKVNGTVRGAVLTLSGFQPWMLYVRKVNILTFFPLVSKIFFSFTKPTEPLDLDEEICWMESHNLNIEKPLRYSIY